MDYGSYVSGCPGVHYQPYWYLQLILDTVKNFWIEYLPPDCVTIDDEMVFI